MGQSSNMLDRAPCRAVQPIKLGPYNALGCLEPGARTEAFICQDPDAESELTLIRRLRDGQDKHSFERDIARSQHLISRYTRSIGLNYEGRSHSKSKPFVSEPLSLLLSRSFEDVTPLPLPVAISITHGILQSLLACNSLPLHGDLVPHHVLLGYDGTIQLLDPAGPEDGIARARKSTRSNYRSPEHIENSGLKKASDIFVIGILLYEMTTGESMFDRNGEVNDSQILHGKYRRPRSLVGRSYPIELQVVLRKMLSPSIEHRFTSAQNALDGLDLIAGPHKTHHARIIQAHMHKSYPDYYSAWREIFEDGGIQLPPPEVTEPGAQPQNPNAAKSLDDVRRPTLRSDTQASTDGPVKTDSASSMPNIEPSSFTTDALKDSAPAPDSEFDLREEPTHVAPISPELQKFAVDKPGNRLPPLPDKIPTNVDSRVEMTNPHVVPPEMPEFDDDADKEEEADPTPTPIIMSGRRMSTPAERPDSELEDLIPLLNVSHRSETISEAPPVTAPQMEPDSSPKLHSLVDTSDLSIEEDELPLDKSDLDHLRLAADLLEHNPELTDRSDVEDPRKSPFLNTEDEEDEIPLVFPAANAESIEIPQPRKIVPRSESDWSQSMAEGESSGRIKMPEPPARPRPLERLTRDSIIQAAPKALLAEDTDASGGPVPRVPHRHEATQVVRERSKPVVRESQEEQAETAEASQSSDLLEQAHR